MADEPENHTIRLLREMREEMRQGFEGIEARQDQAAVVLGKVIDAVTSMAKVQEQHTALLRNHGARLAAIEGRLAIIEEHTGLIKV